MPYTSSRGESLVSIITLAGIIAVLVVLLLPGRDTRADRYAFYRHQASNEIYVFDTRTGTVYMTSPETIGEYGDEIWARLNPVAPGRAISFKDFLRDTAGRRMHQQIVEQQLRQRQDAGPVVPEPAQ